ncbi:MAG: hypothetical protein V1833_01750 [Elusimicrobiota bacterium]
MIKEIGKDFAEYVANNHELNPGSQKSRNMDLWNNEIGRAIGQKLKD